MSEESNQNCDPLYGQVDAILERKNAPLRFSEIKERVDASSTTVSRRLGELIDFGLIQRTKVDDSAKTFEYEISDSGKKLSPIMQSFYDWVQERDSN